MNVIEHDSQSPRLLIDGGKKYPSVMPVLPTALHDHPFAEVHIITQGEALYIVDGITHTVSEGSAILIPAEKYHAVALAQNEDNRAFRIVFHVDIDTCALSVTAFPMELLQALAKDLESGVETPSIYHRLFFIVGELIGANEFSTTPFSDHKLMIREFFSLNYDKNIRLCDLSRHLCLSDMQTQRLIKKYTGMTFGEYLLHQRMTVVQNLMETTSMTLAEIARYVGYNSYCGFWKAYKKFKQEMEKQELSAQTET